MPGLSEAAAAVEVLVGLAEDSRSHAATFDSDINLCTLLQRMLQKAQSIFEAVSALSVLLLETRVCDTVCCL